MLPQFDNAEIKNLMKSLFICDPHDLDAPVAGGVQLCSREFLAIVQGASETTSLLSVSVTRAPVWRLRRRLRIGSYLFYKPSEAREALMRASHDRPTHVFLNRCELLRLAPLVRQCIPEAKVIVMSHGNQTGDDLYEVAGASGRRSSKLWRFIATWQLGSDLVAESVARHKFLDGACVMSDEEEVLERWLGAKKTLVLPRLIEPDPLDWHPVSGRVGFVGTLDHTPNRVALEQLCECLVGMETGGLELRLVGGPINVGEALEARYPFVRYLGKLSDGELSKEVSSWLLFLNPIFWLSRGASMKLAKALAWCVPALTTRSGTRGYRLSQDEAFTVEDNVTEFASRLIGLIPHKSEIQAMRETIVRSQNEWQSISSLSDALVHRFG